MTRRMPIAMLIALLLLILATSSVAAQPFTDIGAPSAPGAAEPFLFAAKDSLLLSWLEPVEGSKDFALRFARYRNGQWSESRTIVQRNDLFVNWADFPSIVEDSNGVLYAHWVQKNGPAVYAYDVQVSISTDGGKTWSRSFPLNRDGKQTEHGFVSLAPLKGGGIAATWLDGRNMIPGKEEGEMTLRYATIDARGRIKDDQQLDARTCECCNTGMALTAAGPLVLYRDRTGDEIRDISYVRKLTRGWTTARPLNRDGWKITGCPVNGPQVDAMGNDVVAAWFTAAEDRPTVYVSFSSDGGEAFSAPTRVDDGKPLGRVDVVLFDAQTAIVTWLETTGSGAEVRARRVKRSGSAETSLKIADSSAARGAGFPRLARTGRNVFFTWTEQHADSKRIRVAGRAF